MSDINALVRHIPAAVIEMDRSGLVRAWNKAAEELFGFPAAEVLGCPLPSYVGRKSLQRYIPALLGRLERLSGARTPYALDVRYRHPSGATLHIELRLAAIYDPDGGLAGLVAVCTDATRSRLRERALRFAAQHDGLTGLPNKDTFTARVMDQLHQQELLRKKDTARLTASTGVIVIDIHRFKEINDGLGRAGADVLLTMIGPRLVATAVRATDMVARTAGDQFSVLLPHIDGIDTATAIAERVLGALHRPFRVGGVQIDLTARIGLAVSPDHGTSADKLLQNADDALFDAKIAGADIAVYRGADTAAPLPHFGLLGQLRHAIDEGQLVMHFQPKIDIASGEVCGAEALVRWQHPERGLLPPGEFMPMAESTGLINQLTDYVVDRSLAQAGRWLAAGRHLAVAVNLSARNLHDVTLPERIAAALTRHEVPANRLHLEITETAVMHNLAVALEVLDDLVHTGVGLSLDDFGTGYSSMSYLQRLPVAELKVDRSFVSDLVNTHADRELVRLAIGLGHSLGLQVVAEGVENAETLEMLGDLGADIAQGYFVARPMPAAQFNRWLETRETQQPSLR